MSLSEKLLEQLGSRLRNVERSSFCDWVSSVLHDMEPGTYSEAQREVTSVLFRYIGPAAAPAVQQSTYQPQAEASHLQPVPTQFDQQWQPPPSQWPPHVPPASVWDSMESIYMQKAMPHRYNRQSSCPSSSTPAQDSSSPNPSNGLNTLLDDSGSQDTSFVSMLLGSSSQKTHQSQQVPQQPQGQPRQGQTDNDQQ